MTVLSFPNKFKYRGELFAPHTAIEVPDVDVPEMVQKGAHILQHFDDPDQSDVDEVEFKDVEDDMKEPEDDVVDSDGSEPLSDDEDEFGDDDVESELVVEPPVVPSRRNTKAK